MKKLGVLRLMRAMALLMALVLCVGALPTAAYAANPRTAYAEEFLALCDGQDWFIDEIERILNTGQKSLDTITSRADFAGIVALGFAGQNIEGVIPRAVGELTALRDLFLSGNRLAAAPDALYTLAKLENLDLSGNHFTGNIPAQLGTMPSLRILMLADNGYTGSIPASILGNTKLEVLDVSGNQLTGGLPAGLNNMTALTYLSVSQNQWGGPLPDLSALTRLNVLSAWECGLTGAIPDSLYNLNTLQILDLAGNRLEGGISADIGSLTDLQLLALGSNDLTGPIPPALGGLTRLTALDLSGNRLDGIIPDCFAGLTELAALHIENNRLRGVLPASLDTQTVEVFAQNNYLTGANLLTAADDARNFADGAGSEQYQLTGPQKLVLASGREAGAEVAVFSQLQNSSLVTGNTLAKPMLPADCYTARIVNDPRGKVVLRVDATGISVSMLHPAPSVSMTQLLESEGVYLEITIAGNDGSAYSTVSILLTTEVPPPTPPTPRPPSSGVTAPDPVVPLAPPDAAHTAYVDGYPDGQFHPGDGLTREQAAKLIVHAVGGELEPPRYARFPDVAVDRWSAPSIDCAYRQGWLVGMPDGTFMPERTMTRAEFATCLVRVWGGAAYDAANARDFPDVAAGEWYYDAVRKASAIGLMEGRTDGTFGPQDPVTRAEAVTVLNRLLGRDPATAPELKAAAMPFSDVPETHWAYWHILEASVEHTHPAQ